MAESFLWVHRTLAFLVAPIVVFLSFASPDLFPLIGKAQWVGAAPAAVVLAWAALLRVLAQAFPDIYHASGRPGYAVANSVLSLILLVATFGLAIGLFTDRYGTMAVAYAWLLIYPLLLAILWLMAKRLVPLTLRAHAKALLHPFLSALVMVAACFALDALLGWAMGETGGHLVRLVAFALVVLAISVGYPKVVLGLSLRKMIRSVDDAGDGEAGNRPDKRAREVS